MFHGVIQKITLAQFFETRSRGGFCRTVVATWLRCDGTYSAAVGSHSHVGRRDEKRCSQPAWFIFRRSRLRSAGGRRRAAWLADDERAEPAFLAAASTSGAAAAVAAIRWGRLRPKSACWYSWLGAPASEAGRELVTKSTGDDTSVFKLRSKVTIQSTTRSVFCCFTVFYRFYR